MSQRNVNIVSWEFRNQFSRLGRFTLPEIQRIVRAYLFSSIVMFKSVDNGRQEWIKSYFMELCEHDSIVFYDETQKEDDDMSFENKYDVAVVAMDFRNFRDVPLVQTHQQQNIVYNCWAYGITMVGYEYMRHCVNAGKIFSPFDINYRVHIPLLEPTIFSGVNVTFLTECLESDSRYRAASILALKHGANTVATSKGFTFDPHIIVNWRKTNTTQNDYQNIYTEEDQNFYQNIYIGPDQFEKVSPEELRFVDQYISSDTDQYPMYHLVFLSTTSDVSTQDMVSSMNSSTKFIDIEYIFDVIDKFRKNEPIEPIRLLQGIQEFVLLNDEGIKQLIEINGQITTKQIADPRLLKGNDERIPWDQIVCCDEQYLAFDWMVPLIINRFGGSINDANRTGENMLHYAVATENPTLCQALLTFGVDTHYINRRNRRGVSALKVAEELESWQCFGIIWKNKPFMQ